MFHRNVGLKQLRPIHTVRLRLRQRHFFLRQVMGSMATNGSVHINNCVSDIYCDTDFNAKIVFFFDDVADTPCELSFRFTAFECKLF